jgi:anti-sigma factor RsiW
MKRFFNCSEYHESLCLLASSALPESDRVEIENHLAACADCKSYYDEIRKVAVPLANWEKEFAHIAPDYALQMRWANAIRTAGEPKTIRTLSLGLALRTAWRELIWPCRRIWTGLAAAWLAILALNLAHSERGQMVATRATTPPGEIRLVFQEQQRVLAEIIGPTLSASPAEPPRRPNNQPRSERRAVSPA